MSRRCRFDSSRLAARQINYPRYRQLLLQVRTYTFKGNLGGPGCIPRVFAGPKGQVCRTNGGDHSVSPYSRSCGGARLKIGTQKVTGEILEQSAGGFRIEVPLRTKVVLNDVVDLETWGGSCQVLVVFIDDTNKCRRLGLQRITDEVPTRMRWIKFRFRQVAPKKPANVDPVVASQRPGKLMAAGSLLALLVTAAWLLLRTEGGASVGEYPTRRHGSKDPHEAAVAGMAEGKDSPAADEAAEHSSDDGVKSPSSRGAQPRISPETVTVLERLAALQTPKTAAELDLTEGQKLQIRRLMSDITSGLARLQSRRSPNPAIQRKNISKLAAKAEERALEILTPEQRARWRPDISMRLIWIFLRQPRKRGAARLTERNAGPFLKRR